MQVIINEDKSETGFKIQDLTIEDRQKLVGAFIWLLQEDKKQNPAPYQRKNITK